MLFRGKKRGQVAIFIVVALVIVAAVLIFYILTNDRVLDQIPEELSPVFSYYESCIENGARNAVSLAGSQGGRIDTGQYIPGSDFAPFSNQLNFLGFPVPYWFYVAGNGVVRENVPTEREIESELEEFIRISVQDCDFEPYLEQGFLINVEDPEVRVSIADDSVDVVVVSNLEVSREDVSASRRDHGVSVASEFGRFYDLATDLYGKQISEGFLENYTVDVLRLYAPVDGVAIECEPQVWETREVESELKEALEANIGSLRLQGNYYDLSEQEREYFVVDMESEESVNFLYSRNWPTKLEITGSGVEEEVLVAEPVGTQSGLGVLGFCYVPYHFVYDLSYPVMVQIYNNDEVFQFPVVVVLENNLPRNVSYSELSLEEEDFDFCEYKTEKVDVNIYDINLESVDGRVYYECFNQRCSLGESEEGFLDADVPACVNGYINVRAEGYTDKSVLFSSNSERAVDVILDRERAVNVQLYVDGERSDNGAVVTFNSLEGDLSASAVLPGNEEIKLSEGLYDVSVYVYSDSDITIPASSRTECTEVPRTGLAGFFGGTKEECYDISIPEIKIDNALSGGGKSEVYLFDFDLDSGQIILDVDSLPRPDSLERLQYNFEIFERQGVEVSFE